MGPLTITDSDGKVISLSGIDLKDLVKIVNKSQARKNKAHVYTGLKEIVPADENKGIRFVCESGNHFEFSFITKEFVHVDKSTFLPAHFRHIDIKSLKENGFWSYLKASTKETWIYRFFDLVLNHIQRYEGTSARCIAKTNCLQYLSENIKEYIDIFEGIAKAVPLQKFDSSSVLNMSRQCAKNGEVYGPAKLIIQNNLDNWFIEHQDEVCTVSWWGHGQGQTSLKNEITKYQAAKTGKYNHVFEYCWEKYKIPFSINGYNARDKFMKMINEFRYDYRRLIDYLMSDLAHQGKVVSRNSWSGGDFLTDLYDYANMNNEMGVKYEKYPKHLATMHDITAANYNHWRSRTSSRNGYGTITRSMFEDLEYNGDKDDKFTIVIPNDAGDIIREGASLNHCVASYIDRVIARNTSIVFMRSKALPEESLVTTEVCDYHVQQARGHSNRNLFDYELEFIEKYREFLAKQKEKKLKQEELALKEKETEEVEAA